jgi:hypothetical protein
MKNLLLASAIASFAFVGCATQHATPYVAQTKTENPTPVWPEGREDAVMPFSAWKKDDFVEKYGVRWTGIGSPCTKWKSLLCLTETNWHASYASDRFGEFRTGTRFEKYENNAQRNFNDLTNPEYPAYLANRVARWFSIFGGKDGVFFDWWHNDLRQGYGENGIRKFSKGQVKEARRAILEEFASNPKTKDLIIIGNVNDRKDDLAPLYHGVFLEMFKSYRGSYSSNAWATHEDVIRYYNKNLKGPKIIAYNVWKVSPRTSDRSAQVAARQSEENKQYSRLASAMVSVVADNGYILYGDNNFDIPAGDHHHSDYEQYNFKIGKPVSGEVALTEGVGVKYFEEGFVGYNRTSGDAQVVVKGKTYTIPALDGIFIKY